MSSILTKEQKVETFAINFEQVLKTIMAEFEPTTGFKLFWTSICIYAKSSGDKCWFIDHAGAFFYKYKEQIIEKNIKFFVEEYDYKDQMEDWIKATNGYGESVALGFVDILKSNVKRLAEKDPDNASRMSKSLLNLYIKYLKELKNC